MAEAKQFPNTNYMYYKPETCVHPARIRKVEVIHEEKTQADNSYTLAKLTYDTGETALGIRWNIAYDQYKDERCQKGEVVCLGFPYSHSYPTWFILPQNSTLTHVLSIPLSKGV